MLTPKVVRLCAAKRARLPQARTARQAPEPTRYNDAPRQIATPAAISHRAPGGAAAWSCASARIRTACARNTAPAAASGSAAISTVSAPARLQVTGLS